MSYSYREAALNWLALGLLLAAWNASDDLGMNRELPEVTHDAESRIRNIKMRSCVHRGVICDATGAYMMERKDHTPQRLRTFVEGCVALGGNSWSQPWHALHRRLSQNGVRNSAAQDVEPRSESWLVRAHRRAAPRAAAGPIAA